MDVCVWLRSDRGFRDWFSVHILRASVGIGWSYRTGVFNINAPFLAFIWGAARLSGGHPQRRCVLPALASTTALYHGGGWELACRWGWCCTALAEVAPRWWKPPPAATADLWNVERPKLQLLVLRYLVDIILKNNLVKEIEAALNIGNVEKWNLAQFSSKRVV